MILNSYLQPGNIRKRATASLCLLGLSTLVLAGCNSEPTGKPLPPGPDGKPTVQTDMKKAPLPPGNPGTQESTFVNPGGK